MLSDKSGDRWSWWLSSMFNKKKYCLQSQLYKAWDNLLLSTIQFLKKKHRSCRAVIEDNWSPNRKPSMGFNTNLGKICRGKNHWSCLISNNKRIINYDLRYLFVSTMALSWPITPLHCSCNTHQKIDFNLMQTIPQSKSSKEIEYTFL